MPTNLPTDVTVQSASFEAPVPPLSTAPAQVAPSPPTAPGVSDDTSDAQAGGARSVLQIPSNAMSKIRKDERAKGARAHQKKLDDEARALGFESHAALIAFAQERKGRAGVRTSSTAAPAAPTTAPAVRRVASTAAPTVSVSTPPDEGGSRVSVRSASKVRASERLLAQERKKLRRAQHELNAERAASIMRIEALRAGITDVDYALHLAREHVRRIPPAKLKSFNERTFFAETLRTSHPHLFDTTQPAPAAPPPKPVTTGPSGGEPAPSAQAGGRGNGAPAPQNGTPPPAGGPRDMRTATPDQVNERLRQLGLAPPGSSLPI